MSTEINSALSQSSKSLLKVLEETLPPITNILNSSFQNEKTINISISESPKKKLNEQNDSIKTFCRIRPFNGINLLFHRSKTDPKILNVNSENLQKLNINTNLKLINSYKFSKVFTEENTQVEIFNETCKNLIDDLVFNHKSGLIFTYGMTNAGKTFTVIGSPNNPGILPQSLILFFDYFQNKQLNDYNLFCNFVEIYNDEVFDLLSNDETGKNKFYKKKLNVKENINNIFYLPDVTYQKLNSLKDFNDSLNLGVSKKVHSSTNLNQNSSRSHTIFKIILKKENENYQNNNILEQEISLSIVDLAGSERAKRTDTSGKELQEACKINQSLSILGKCLEAMKHNSLFTQKKLVPFRESKLTKLFCEYFQGEQNIIMITNINPRKEDFEESIRALNYSCLAKDIRPIKSVLNINNKNSLKLINRKKDNNQNKNEEKNKEEINVNKISEDEKKDKYLLNNSNLDCLSNGEYIINSESLKVQDESSNALTVKENNSVDNSDIQKLIKEIQNLRSEVLGLQNSNINNNLNFSTAPNSTIEDLNDNCLIKKESSSNENLFNLNYFYNNGKNNNNNQINYSNHLNSSFNNNYNPYFPYLPNNSYYNNNTNNNPLLPSPFPINIIKNDYPKNSLERQINEELNLIPPQAKNNGLNFIFINSRFSDFHMGKNCSILEENENESEEDDKPKNKKRNNKNNKKKKKIPFKKNKKQYNRNKKKNTLDYSNESLNKNSNLSTPKRNYKSEGNIDIIESKIFIGEKEKDIKTPSKEKFEKKNNNDLFQTVPNNKYKSLFEDFMF